MTLPSLPPIPPSGASKSDSYLDATPLDLTGILELRFNSPSVGLYPVAPPTISEDILAATSMTPGANSPSTPLDLPSQRSPQRYLFDVFAKRRLNGGWYGRSRGSSGVLLPPQNR